MNSISTPHGDLVAPLTPAAAARPTSAEARSSLVVLAVLVAAIVTGAMAQLRSAPLAGELGPEAAALALAE